MIKNFPGFEATSDTEPFWFLGGQARILLPGRATGDAMSVMEFSDPIGQAPPHHVHENEEELWFVLDGEVSFFVGDKRHDLTPDRLLSAHAACRTATWSVPRAHGSPSSSARPASRSGSGPTVSR